MKYLIISLVIVFASCDSTTNRPGVEEYAVPESVFPMDSLLAKYSTTTPLLMLFDSANRRVNLGPICFADFPQPITNGLKSDHGFFNYSIEHVLNEMKASPLDTIKELREYKCLYGFNPSAPEHLRETLKEYLKQSEFDFYKNFPDGIFIIINTEWNEDSWMPYEKVIEDRIKRREEESYYSSTQ